MHLSHNQLTEKGVRELIIVAEKTRPRHSNPLWLRIEQNQVSDPQCVYNELLQKKLSLCDKRDKSRCTVHSCINYSKVHLPFFNQPVKDKHGRGQGQWRDKTWENSSYREERDRGDPSRTESRVTLTARSKVDTKERGDGRWDHNGRQHM